MSTSRKSLQAAGLHDFALVFDAIDAAVTALLNTNPNLTNDDLLQCLKIVAKSISRWTKQLGRQGYLKFVSQYF